MYPVDLQSILRFDPSLISSQQKKSLWATRESISNKNIF